MTDIIFQDVEDYKPGGLTLGDLHKSMADVALEMATREAIWSACLGTTATAMGTQLPEQVTFELYNATIAHDTSTCVAALRCNKHYANKVNVLQIKTPSPLSSGRSSKVSARSSAAVAKIESVVAQAEEIKVNCIQTFLFV